MGLLLAIAGCLLLVGALFVVFGAGHGGASGGPDAAHSTPLAPPLAGGDPSGGAMTAPLALTSASATLGPTPSATRSSASPSPKPKKSTPPPSKAGTRQVTFVNAVSQTIWLAGWQQTAKPTLTTTGWVLKSRQTLTITVPDKWNGRFWGRTGCVFNSSGSGHCQTGDCGGKFQCRGYGGIPATLAEYNLNSFDNLDFYDVSMVDGSNLPMYINITKGKTKDKISSTGCSPAGCTKPVDCPTVLDVNVGGKRVGCISACARLNTDQYCCRGKWAPRPDCDPTKWPVNYAAVFKKAEPYAYSYSDDDATSTFTCTGECDYRITFGTTP
jgi:hypothetical protein